MASYGALGGSSDGLRRVVVTGGAGGIGYEGVARILETGKYEVIISGRNQAKGDAAVASLKKEVKDAVVSFRVVDLASMASIHAFAEGIIKDGIPIAVLLNNAGLSTSFMGKLTTTKDGFETIFGVNHLGHFLLTSLLFPLLVAGAKQPGGARIVNVSSMMHEKQGAHIDFDDLQLLKSSKIGARAYGNSKLANILHVMELDRRIKAAGIKNLTANALHPGFIPGSDFGRDQGCCGACFLAFMGCLCGCCKCVTQHVSDGGKVEAFVATDPSIQGVSATYFNWTCRPKQSSAESRDPVVGKKLWDASSELVKVDPDFVAKAAGAAPATANGAGGGAGAGAGTATA